VEASKQILQRIRAQLRQQTEKEEREGEKQCLMQRETERARSSFEAGLAEAEPWPAKRRAPRRPLRDRAHKATRHGIDGAGQRGHAGARRRRARCSKHDDMGRDVCGMDDARAPIGIQ
jgi:hypothetical protein